MGRSMLRSITDGDTFVCAVMPEEEEREFAGHYGTSDCAETIIELGKRHSINDRADLLDVEMTLLDTREIPVKDSDGGSVTAHRARLGENPFGWREIEFVPERQALVSVRW